MIAYIIANRVGAKQFAAMLRIAKLPRPYDVAMPADYFPLLVMLVVAVAFAAIGVGVSAIIGPRRPTVIKGQTYESGMPSIGTARRRVWVRYYLVAVVFILFDIEIIFLYPWAVIFRVAPLFLLAEMAVFVAILLVGYVYVWRKGGFEWY